MKLIAIKEVSIEDIIPFSLLYEREDLGNLNEITGDIFTPIIIRPSKIQSGKFERITGLRRYKKAEKHGKKTILCAIYEMTDEEAIFIHAKENLQRKDLNPIEEGKQHKIMLQTLKITQEELAKKLREGGLKRSQEHINNRIRLLNLAEPVQEYLALNKLSVYHGLLLLQIKDEKSQIELAEMCVSNNYTTRQLEQKMIELEERQARYHHFGQTKFVNGGARCVLPPPQIIQPEPKPIKLIRTEPKCPEMTQKLKEAQQIYLAKNRASYPPPCHMCPLIKLCAMIGDYKQSKLFDPEYTSKT